MKQVYRYTDEKSDKFWYIDYSGTDLMVNFGKTGTSGRFQVKEFDDQAACEKEAGKLIASKVKKGYALWEDFDFNSHLYYDDEEVGVHPKTSHPNFSAHFTEEFYYSCVDEEAPFGSDEGDDTLASLCEYIKKNRETDLVEYPRDFIENEWGMLWFEPTESTEEDVKAILEAPPKGELAMSSYLYSCDIVVIATAFGQIKVMGSILERLRQMALFSLKRMAIFFKLEGDELGYAIPQMIKDLESFKNPEYTPTEDCQTIVSYLGCPCEVFAPVLDDDNMIFAYENACREGAEQGYTPILIKVDDILLEAITLAVDDDSDMDFDAGKVSTYRKETIAKIAEVDVAKLLTPNEDIGDISTKLKGKIKIDKGEKLTRFSEHWDYDNKFSETGAYSKYCCSHEMILAKLPTKNPWEAAVYVPMGGFNECPMPEEQAAVMKYWYEKHGAIPAMVSHATWEFMATPLISQTEKKLSEADEERLMELAIEQFVFCLDRIDQYGGENYVLGDLASSLAVSTKWYFWWD